MTQGYTGYEFIRDYFTRCRIRCTECSSFTNNRCSVLDNATNILDAECYSVYQLALAIQQSHTEEERIMGISKRSAEFKNKKYHVLIITHSHCADGLASAAVATKKLVELLGSAVNIEYWPAAYKVQELAAISEQLASVHYDAIYCVDYSLPVALIEQVNDLGSTQLVIIDHHKTAKEMYFSDRVQTVNIAMGINTAIIVEDEECGATASWNYFFPEHAHMPSLLAYIRDYDLWIKDYGDTTEALNLYIKQLLGKVAFPDLGLDTLPAYTYAVDAIIDLMNDEAKTLAALEEGRKMLEAFNEVVRYYTDKAELMVHPDLPEVKQVAVVATPYKYVSAVGNALCTKYKVIAVLLPMDISEASSISLRSNDTIPVDVSAIAKSLGGGGHRNAAGFPWDSAWAAKLSIGDIGTEPDIRH
jgi:uncharacterized protein